MKTPIRKNIASKFYSSPDSEEPVQAGISRASGSGVRGIASGLANVSDYIDALNRHQEKLAWAKQHIGEDNFKDRLSSTIYRFSSMASGSTAYFRRTAKRTTASQKQADVSAMLWLMSVEQKVEDIDSTNRNALQRLKKLFDDELLNAIGKLSAKSNGPLLAVKMLRELGLLILTVPGPVGTPIDALSMLSRGGNAVVAMSLRYDRLDNFWFTLLHELAHIRLHVGAGSSLIVDDFDSQDINDDREQEANRIARDAMIPRAIWRRSEAFKSRDKASVLQLARELKIDPSIVAGRIRYETGNYMILSELVGAGRVHELFANA
jgi:HTH-type transcriptional regulator/antitoxin HigA